MERGLDGFWCAQYNAYGRNPVGKIQSMHPGAGLHTSSFIHTNTHAYLRHGLIGSGVLLAMDHGPWWRTYISYAYYFILPPGMPLAQRFPQVWRGIVHARLEWSTWNMYLWSGYVEGIVGTDASHMQPAPWTCISPPGSRCSIAKSRVTIAHPSGPYQSIKQG